MIFKKEITIPANTPKLNYQTDEITLTSGIITSVEVFLPWGCANLVGVRLFYTNYQLVPISREEWLTGNDFFHKYEYRTELNTEPYSLIIQSYNLDDAFTHSPIISVVVSRNVMNNKLRQLLDLLK